MTFGCLAVSSSGFSLFQIPNLVAWYDAADTSTITASANLVSQWNDKSGNGYNATQATGAKQPGTNGSTQNGRNVLTFDGGDTLVLPSGLFTIPNSASTIFAVAKITSETGNQQHIFSLSKTFQRYEIFFGNTAGHIEFLSNNAATPAADRSGNTNTNWTIMRGRRSGTTMAVSFNNSAETTNTSANNESGITEGYIGSVNNNSAGTSLTGSIGEIIIYTRSLSTTEMTSVQNYLSQKWSITLS